MEPNEQQTRSDTSTRCPAVPLMMDAVAPVAISSNVVAVPGHFKGHVSGEFELTTEIFNQIVRNFERDPFAKIQVDADHRSETLKGGPLDPLYTAAWIKKLWVKDSDLWGEFHWCDQKAVDMVRAGQIVSLSPAISFNAVDYVTGEDIGAVLTSVALTGHPFLRHLPGTLTASTPTVAVLMRAVSYKEAPVVDGAWDASAAEKRLQKWASSDGSGDTDKIDWKKYSEGFALVSGEGDKLGDYRLPHHDIRDGKLVTVKQGVIAAIAALHGARGGMKDVSAEEKKAAESHLEKHKAQWESVKNSLPVGDVHLPGSIKVKKMEPDEEKKAKEAKMAAEAAEMTAKKMGSYEGFMKKMRKLFEMKDADGDDDGDTLYEMAKSMKEKMESMDKMEAARMTAEAEMRVAARVDGGMIPDNADARKAALAICMSNRAQFDALYPEPKAPKADGKPTTVTSHEQAILMGRVLPQVGGAQKQSGVDTAVSYRDRLFALTNKIANEMLTKNPELDVNVVYLDASHAAKEQLAGA